MDENTSQLATALREMFGQCDGKVVGPFLDVWPSDGSAASSVNPKQLAVQAFLTHADAYAPSASQRVVQDLAAHQHVLEWRQTYTEADFGRSFLDRYGWTMLVGPDAPVKSDALLAGFLLLGPGVEYPVHKHAAEEVYLVLSGAASWKIGAQDWTPLPALSLVHNPPWQEHGMRTDQDQPLLLGFMWRAGRVEKSQMVDTHP